MKSRSQALIAVIVCCAAVFPFLHDRTSKRETTTGPEGSAEMPAATRVLPITEVSGATSLSHADLGDASSQEAPNSGEPQQGSQFRSAIEVDDPRGKQSH